MLPATLKTGIKVLCAPHNVGPRCSRRMLHAPRYIPELVSPKGDTKTRAAGSGGVVALGMKKPGAPCGGRAG